MRERVRALRRRRGTRLEWVPLWGTVSPESVDSTAAAAGGSGGAGLPTSVVLLYSGNMGLGHRLGEFLSAAGELGERGPVWAFAGGGRRRSEVEAFVAAQPSARVQLLPYVAQEDVAASLAAADVHLVSLRSAWQGLIVPSKLQAAFTLGRPVIFVGPRENEAADWVLASGGGWVVGEDDVRGLMDAVASAVNPAERVRRGELARAYARQHFDRETNTTRIAELLESSARDRLGRGASVRLSVPIASADRSLQTNSGYLTAHFAGRAGQPGFSHFAIEGGLKACYKPRTPFDVGNP